MGRGHQVYKPYFHIYHFSYIKDLHSEILLSLYYPINYQGGFAEDE